MNYPIAPFPFRHRQLPTGGIVAVSDTGDHAFLSNDELAALEHNAHDLSVRRLAELKSKFFVGNPRSIAIKRLLKSRVAARNETILSGPSLHIVVPTLRCAHSCRYCQVSRALEDNGYTISMGDLNAACDSIFHSPSQTLTVEFQGGDPLLRFDLVRHAIDRISERNDYEKRNLRFIVASTLHQLDNALCEYFKEHKVYLSTSIDGPAELHNRNRPLPTRDAYERTVRGIEMAREQISTGSVSALMTTTRESLNYPEAIVDEYVALGLNDLFIRPLSRYGFAKRNKNILAYSLDQFHVFYKRIFDRVLYWNSQGVAIREVGASIALNKILSPFDSGYVDLQSPTGAGLATLVYNYDGHVYPSDEARMLAEAGDVSLRLGKIGQPLDTLQNTELQRGLVAASQSHTVTGCKNCAYNKYCGPDPVGAYNELGSISAPVGLTNHCQHYMWLFDFLFEQLHEGHSSFMELAYRWAQPGEFRKDTSDA